MKGNNLSGFKACWVWQRSKIITKGNNSSETNENNKSPLATMLTWEMELILYILQCTNIYPYYISVLWVFTTMPLLNLHYSAWVILLKYLSTRIYKLWSCLRMGLLHLSKIQYQDVLLKLTILVFLLFRRNYFFHTQIDHAGFHLNKIKWCFHLWRVWSTKGAIRIRISKKNRQHNGQKKKYKRTKKSTIPHKFNIVGYHQNFICG